MRWTGCACTAARPTMGSGAPSCCLRTRSLLRPLPLRVAAGATALGLATTSPVTLQDFEARGVRALASLDERRFTNALSEVAEATLEGASLSRWCVLAVLLPNGRGAVDATCCGARAAGHFDVPFVGVPGGVDAGCGRAGRYAAGLVPAGRAAGRRGDGFWGRTQCWRNCVYPPRRVPVEQFGQQVGTLGLGPACGGRTSNGLRRIHISEPTSPD